MNIKQDAVMKKLGITDQELVEAEDQSDRVLEKEKRGIRKKAANKRSSKKG